MSLGPEGSDPHVQKSSLAAISLAALGIVYGDIGTSPLYALRECFHGPHAIELNEVSLLGVLSLIFWVLILVISIKYMVFVLRADNRGEGGILALTALASPMKQVKASWLLIFGIFGAALLYGDGVLTPAVSVLSAVEGLKIATPGLEPFVLPISVVILIALFWLQKRGTARIGAVFGPIMVLWFLTIGTLGVLGIVENPSVLRALNPEYAFDFFFHHGTEAYLVMGSLFLVVTGGEALYADMGHFGKSPIRWAWFVMVLPALILNYFGQGALLLAKPLAAENPFYLLAPDWALIPLVVLATVAAVIASQALISGVFSLTRQAIQLGLSPRMQVIHTSNREIGQIYLPQMNAFLLIGCLWLVLTFKTSSNLAAAYGISVSATMVITTILMAAVERYVWKWSWFAVITLTIGFMAVDLVFLSANVIKFTDGGYVPIIIGGLIYLLMATWRRGRQILGARLRTSTIKFQEFYQLLNTMNLSRVSGVAFFMVGDAETTPPAMVHNVKHNKVLHELVIILTLVTKDIPSVAKKDRLKIEKIDEQMYRVIAKYGFIDTPDVVEIVEALQEIGLPIKLADITFFLGRETLIATPNPGMAIWREHLFSFMSRNAQRATAYFNIPADQVVEVGIQVEL